jgi:hypothetical protein
VELTQGHVLIYFGSPGKFLAAGQVHVRVYQPTQTFRQDVSLKVKPRNQVISTLPPCQNNTISIFESCQGHFDCIHTRTRTHCTRSSVVAVPPVLSGPHGTFC